MSLAVVLGPSLGSLADGLDLLRSDDPAKKTPGRAVSVRVRGAAESAAERRDALREMLRGGVDTVLILDAAAPARPDWGRAGLALVADHIGLTGNNPLIGVNDEAWGPRFPDLTDAWDPDLRRALRAAAAGARVELREGVVASVTSDRLTTAELAMLRTLGADMGSVGFTDEAIVARHAGRRVAGVALLATDGQGPAEEEVESLESLLRVALPLLTGTGRPA